MNPVKHVRNLYWVNYKLEIRGVIMTMNLIYAGLLLHSAGKDIDEDSVKKVAHATGDNVDEASVKAFVTAIKDENIEEAISKAAMPVAVAGPVAAGGAAASEEKKESPEEAEKKAEAAAEGLGSLFG